MPTVNRYLSGVNAPVDQEITAFDLPVTGSLPTSLSGRYLRIGPNPVGTVDPGSYHWFTGDGMAHGICLRDGKAEWYRNRWVRSNSVTAAMDEPDLPGEVHGFDTVNTNIIGLDGSTFALVEAGARPVELSYELESICRTDFGGTLPNGFSAHPKRDPLTGELFAAAYYWGLEGIQYIVVGADAKVRKLETISVAGAPMMHDMSITEKHAVFYDLPVVFDTAGAVKGGFPYCWDDKYTARIGVMPREGTDADVRWFEVAACYMFHTVNAFDRQTEDGHQQVVVDLVRHPQMFATDRLGPNEGTPTLWRWTVDLTTGTVLEEQLDDRAIEFPRLDERLVGRAHRYSYTATAKDDSGMTLTGPGIMKYDRKLGSSQEHYFGKDCAAGEAIFVPESADAAEDRGWLMTLVHDLSTEKSRFVVLAADDLDGGPVATIELPQRVPAGFHGNWVADDR